MYMKKNCKSFTTLGINCKKNRLFVVILFGDTQKFWHLPGKFVIMLQNWIWKALKKSDLRKSIFQRKLKIYQTFFTFLIKFYKWMFFMHTSVRKWCIISIKYLIFGVVYIKSFQNLVSTLWTMCRGERCLLLFNKKSS